MDDLHESSSSCEILNKFTHNSGQNPSIAEQSSCPLPGESSEGKVDGWKSLNDLVEVANMGNSSGESSVTTLQAALDNNDNYVGMGIRKGPVWFELVPSEEQEGEPLGKIDERFIRLKNGNVAVTLIQKLVMIKFGLSSENEVELKCLGQPVDLTLTVSGLLEWWLQRQLLELFRARIGAPAEKFVMKITYARKAPAT